MPVAELLLVGVLAALALESVSLEAARFLMITIREARGMPVVVAAGIVRPGSVLVRLVCYGAIASLAAVLLAMRGSEPISARLGLAAGRASWRVRLTLPVAYLGLQLVFAGASPLLGLASISAAFGQMSGEWWSARHALLTATNGEALVLLLLVGIGPGVGEELLYRGYLQRGLLRYLPAPAAIGLTSIVSVLGTYHPVRGALALPMSLLLGALAWRTGSVLPAIALRSAHNAIMFAFVATIYFQGGYRWHMSLPIALALMAIGLPMMAFGARAMASTPGSRAASLAAPGPPR